MLPKLSLEVNFLTQFAAHPSELETIHKYSPKEAEIKLHTKYYTMIENVVTSSISSYVAYALITIRMIVCVLYV